MTATQPTTKRNKLFDGSKNRHGLSKLMLDIFSPIVIEEPVIENKKEYKILNLIRLETALVMDMTVEQIRGNKRFRNQVTARSMIVFITRYVTDLSLKQIAKEISSSITKDHSTVIHSTNKAFDFIQNKDKNFIVPFEKVLQRIDLFYGIKIDLEDKSKMPLWYKKMLINRTKLLLDSSI